MADFYIRNFFRKELVEENNN
jgi:hypothetical protein